jgi:hypothetical protein
MLHSLRRIYRRLIKISFLVVTFLGPWLTLTMNAPDRAMN